MVDTPPTDDTLNQAAKRAREVLPDPVAEWVENLLLLVAQGFADDANTVRSSVATGLAPAILALPVSASAPDRVPKPEQFRAAYDLLRSAGSPLPKYTSNALVWLLGAIPGEDVDAHGWAPGAWEELRRRVAREILALPAPAPAVDRERVARLIHAEIAKAEFEIDQAHYECGNNAHPARMETWDDLDYEKRSYLLAVDALISAGLIRAADAAEEAPRG